MGVFEPGVLSPPDAYVALAISGPLVLWAKETPAGSVGKIATLSSLPEIHRCISEMYSCAGTSTGSLREFNQVKEWLLREKFVSYFEISLAS